MDGWMDMTKFNSRAGEKQAQLLSYKLFIFGHGLLGIPELYNVKYE